MFLSLFSLFFMLFVILGSCCAWNLLDSKWCSLFLNVFIRPSLQALLRHNIFFLNVFMLAVFFLLLLLLFKGAVYILSNSHCKCRVHEGRLFFSSGLGFFFRAIIFTLFQSVFLWNNIMLTKENKCFILITGSIPDQLTCNDFYVA